MAFNYQHPTFIKAKEKAFSRSEGVCQFCGLEEARHAHHWRGYTEKHYLPEEETTADEITGLCEQCHRIASAIKARHKEMIFKEEDLERRETEIEIQEKEIQENATQIEEELEKIYSGDDRG